MLTATPDNMSWADSRFYAGSRRAGDALVPSLRRHVARQINDFKETERRFRGRVWWYASGAGGTALALEGKSRRRERKVRDVVKLTRVARPWEKEVKPVAERSRHQHNDVSTGRNAVSLRRCCDGSRVFRRSWCGATVRVCQTFSSPS